MTPEQAEHWRALAASHKDTPGDLAAAYRVIGELLDRVELLEHTNEFNCVHIEVLLNLIRDGYLIAVPTNAIERNTKQTYYAVKRNYEKEQTELNRDAS